LPPVNSTEMIVSGGVCALLRYRLLIKQRQITQSDFMISSKNSLVR
jgi:hypothetical protein